MIEKKKRDEFWVLFDKAFNALYTSNEPNHREKVVGGITSMFAAATKCKDLTHNVCGDFYIWLVHHFVKVLIDKDMQCYHQDIISSFSSLLQSVSTGNWILFNKAFGALMTIAESICLNIKDAQSGKKITLHITEYHLTVPKAISKWQFYIDVTKYTSWVSVIDCFIKVSNENFEGISRYSKGFHHRIILLITGLLPFCDRKKQLILLKFICSLITQSSPAFSLLEWRKICYCFKIFEEPNLNILLPEYLDVLNSYYELLNFIISSYKKDFSKVNSLFLESVLEIVFILCQRNVSDVTKWVITASLLINHVPEYFINSLNLRRLIYYLSSQQILYNLFEKYLFKVVEQYISTGIDNSVRTVINIREISDLWSYFLSEFKTFCGKYRNLTLTETKPEIENVIKILAVSQNIRILQEKCNVKFIFFDMFNDHEGFIIHVFKDVVDPSKKELLPLFTKLVVGFVHIVDEKNNFSLKLYKLLLYLFIKNIDPSIKELCLNGIVHCIVNGLGNKCFPLPKVRSVIRGTISSSGNLMDKCYIIIYHCLFEDSSDSVLTSALEQILRLEIDEVLSNSHMRSIMPCFLSGSCILVRDKLNWKLKCSSCDNTGRDLQLTFQKLGLDKYLNLYGFKYLKLLMDPEINLLEKKELLANLHRYLFHISSLKSNETLGILIKYLCSLTFLMDFPAETFKCLLYNEKNDLDLDKVKFIAEQALSFSMKHIRRVGGGWKKTIYNLFLIIAQCFKCFVFSAVKIFFLFFTFPSIETIYLTQKLVDVAKYHNTTMKQLLIFYEVELSKMLIDLVIYNIQNKISDVEGSITHFASVFGMRPMEFLEFRCTSYIITYILLNCDRDQILYLLNRLSDILKITLKDMFSNNFAVIFSTIYFVEDESLLTQSIEILEHFCECNVDSLIYLHYKDLICFIMMNAHRPLKVLRFFHYHIPDPNTKESGAFTLLNHIVGFLTFVDDKLLSSNTPSFIIKSCLRAIPHLIILLGNEHVANISFKLLTTLRTGLPRHYNNYPKLSLRAWIYFLYCINPSFLGPHLPTIVSLLTPLLEKLPIDVSNVLHYLIVKKGRLHHEYLPGLFFVQDSSVPKMHEVWCTIQSSIKSKKMIELIQNTLKHVRNEGVDSRIHYLKFLHEQIRDHKFELLKIIHRGDRLIPVIREIIDCLMTNIQYGNLEVKLTCGDCLGEMGAINPARIGYDYNHCAKRKCYNVETADFAYFVILELTNSLQKSENSYAFNIVASSIQELLKLYFPDKNKERIEEFFKRFPPNERDILKSLLTTRYIFIEPVLIKRDVSKIGSNSGKTTFEWAFSWASELITFIPTDHFCAKVFRICFPSIRLDFQALETLLPHILFQAVLLSKVSDLLFIEMEIKYILNLEGPDYYLPSKKNLTKVQPKYFVGALNSNIREGRCVAIILDLIDFLYVARSALEDGVIDSDHSSNIIRLTGFLNRFSPLSLSLKAYILQDYCRSLFYYERGYSDSSHSDITPLRYIYAKLNDSDGLLGVIRTSKNIPTVEENLLSYVVCGNLQDAVSCYEKLSVSLKSTECSRALIQAYLSINQPQIAKDLCFGVLQQSRYVLPTLCNEQAEVLLRNFLFDEVNDLLKKFNDDTKNNWCWGVDLAIIQAELFSWRATRMNEKIYSVRQHIVEHLSAISNTTLGAYRQGFNHILKLQELNELEKYAFLYKLLQESEVSISEVKKFFDSLDMDLTLDLLPVNGYHLESALNRWQHLLLAIRNFVKPLIPELDEIIASQLGKIYLKAVQISRKSGNLQIANSYMALAEKFSPPGLFIENAKLHKAKSEIETAVLILLQANNQFFPDSKSSHLGMKSRILCAKAKHLIARYNEESVNADFKEVYENYIDAANTFPSEKNYFYLAQYLYKVHTDESLPDNKTAKRENQINAVRYFGLSLKYGCKYIYKSMFCMISLWLDFGMRLREQREVMKNGPKEFLNTLECTMDKFNEVMEQNFSSLPKYVFMAVFSQLISRISHPEYKGKSLLHKMVSNLAIAFPQQAFWMMASFWKMSDADHKKCKEDLIKLIKTEKPDLLSFYSSFIELIDVVINICNKKVPAERLHLPLKSISQRIKLILSKNNIMIPSQKFRTICLPNSKCFEDEIGLMAHNAFPLNLVYFSDVDNTVVLLPSLQRPKKLTFIGSDGMQYPFMCKPMDDLNLDARMMEFSSVINMYLKRVPTSCDRNLYIRTYSVVPITHECGLIEWLPNLCGYRSILMFNYKKRGHSISHAEIKAKIEGCKTIESKIKLFNNDLLPSHPPVLDKWFFLHFSSPDSWYVARQAFIRTAAVMSVVGYVIGLGDRHGENILIDTTNGDVVHVDFNCLFNKAQFFGCPEKVPFRLTQNMIKAMGSLGIEGHFIKSCEITSTVMRSNSDQLMCVLKPFLFDPRVLKKTAEHEKTKHELHIVQKKLAGAVITHSKATKNLSVEGQMRLLVSEATDVRNLSQMFHGWAAYL